MPFVQVSTNNLHAKWGCSSSSDDDKVVPLTDFYNFFFSLPEDFDNLPPRVVYFVLNLRSGDFRNAKWGYYPTRDDNKVGPLTDFDSYWFSCALATDEETQKFSRRPFMHTKIAKWGYSASKDDNKVGPLTDFDNLNCETKIAKWGYSASKDDNKVGPLTDFDNLNCEVGILGFEGRQQSRLKLGSGDSQLRGTTTKSTKIAKWGYSASKDDNKVGPLTDFDNLNCEVGILSFEGRQQNLNCETKIAKWGYSASKDDNKVGPLTDFDNLNCEVGILSFEGRQQNLNCETKIAKWGYSASKDDNKVGPLIDFDNLNCETKIAKWGYSASKDDNKVGPLTDFDSNWFSCVLAFEEET
ncbi:hypothetical protein V1477_003067 [Vespula maculifrons]|uniref:Uncharacterized protein n=1 Tax=Vespula maculifrons TaxID=7453 RepID=A0ABD2CUS1_VESMC